MQWSRRRAAGVGALVLGAAVAAILFVHRPAVAPSAAGGDGQPVPSDLMMRFLESCQEGVPRGSESGTNLSIRPDGVMVAQIISYQVATDAEGITTRRMAIDEDATATVNSCLAERKIEVRNQGRLPTDGERQLLADWVIQVEAPCVVAHGVDVPLPEYSAFLDEQSYPWYLLDSVSLDGDLDFEKLLEIRHACSPMPEFLRNDGVGW